MSNSIDRMELPKWYDENKMVLMVVDPHTVFLYWELAFSQNQAMKEHQIILRLFEQPLEQQLQEQPRLVTSVVLPAYTENWYFNELQPDSLYRAEIGWKQNGAFYSLIKSNIVNVPPAEPLGITGQAKWQSVEHRLLPKTFTAPTARPIETLDEVIQQMSFYMGMHEKS